MSRKERLKVYHGIPKSVTDKHTVFYASFDGSINPEVGEYPSQNRATLLGFKPSYTGYGVTAHDGRIVYPLRNLSDTTTIEFFFSEIPDGRRVLGIRNNDKEILSVFTHIGYLWIGDITLLIAKQQKINHVRLVITKNTRTVYFNGKLLSIQTVTTEAFNQLCLFDFRNDGNASSNCTISDVHISNIDRGDYFPNLPQDFIDGKAIIKPRMGQQQIKGDPMYSQETTDVVKIGANVNEPYITCSRTSGNWINGDTIKVKGLSGEIISGVIDTDTALARVKQVINSKQIFVLDSVQKLSVNDVVRFNIGNSYSPEAIISKIDSDTNTITLSTPLSGWEVATEYYLVETTTTTSSPIVKTSTGTTITGTWSNLGTNEATFTLGTNSSLTNQDLYITYSLNIPAGNSDFTELPYSVEKVYDEIGNELIKVNAIIVEDDFYGKVTGNIKECPHVSKYGEFSSLVPPSNFTNELPNYKNIGSLNDTKYDTIATTSNGKMPIQIFSFNIVEMVERKIGTIPSNNKVQWLKENLEDYCKCSVYGYGKNKSGTLYKLAGWYVIEDTWTVDASEFVTNFTSAIKEVYFESTVFTKRIDNDGFVHFAVYTNASDGVTSSSIYTDYVKLTFQIKKKADFDMFYTENQRARENPCNPILIQKETKTVKRYLPSKECFATESLYSIASGLKYEAVQKIEDKNLYEDKLVRVTTQGTGAYPGNKQKYPNCLAKINASKLQSYNYNNEILEKSNLTLNSKELDGVNFTTQLGESIYANNSYLIPSKRYEGRYVGLAPKIMKIDDKVKLIVYIGEYKGNALLTQETISYDIPNRPLIK